MSIETPVKVLLVSDNVDEYVAIRDLVEGAGNSDIDLHWVDSHRKAVEMLSLQRFNACLTSFELENNSGLEVVKCANVQNAEFPVILITDEDNPTVIEKATSAGACDILLRHELSSPLLKRVIAYSVERKVTEKKLVELSFTDSLTGIPNRSLFQIRLKDAIALSKRQNSLVAILFLDVDNFKDINDLMGYPAGDSLLIEIAKRLKAATRESDIISRLGGDEFSVVATNIQSENDVVSVANRLLDSLIEPITVDSFDFNVSVSIGIALLPSDGETVEEMVRSGDEALFQAKSVRRGSYHFFNREMQDRRIAAQNFEKSLHQSIKNNELFLQYQPIVKLSSVDVVGAEALVRWRNPDKGIVPPDQFISIAERSGFINELGKWVVFEACRQCAAWTKKYSDDFSVAVNVSLAQIRNSDFVEIIQDAVYEAGISYENLSLEITESMLADNASVVIDNLKRLRKLGVRVSIDDFGAGHSSLARLKNIPVDDLKIDRSLISNVAEDRQDAAIAIAILTLARELNLDVIAEGIETQKQSEFMKDQGCAYVQGYYYSKPLVAEDFEAFIEQNLRNTA